jgi:hypothetical protein
VSSDFFRGERQGQEIGAANSAGTQSATSLGPAYGAGCEVTPLCNESGAAVQFKEFIGVIQWGNWTKVMWPAWRVVRARTAMFGSEQTSQAREPARSRLGAATTGLPRRVHVGARNDRQTTGKNCEIEHKRSFAVSQDAWKAEGQDSQ